jgi:hypothetical protein
VFNQTNQPFATALRQRSFEVLSPGAIGIEVQRGPGADGRRVVRVSGLAAELGIEANDRLLVRAQCCSVHRAECQGSVCSVQ